MKKFKESLQGQDFLVVHNCNSGMKTRVSMIKSLLENLVKAEPLEHLKGNASNNLYQINFELDEMLNILDIQEHFMCETQGEECKQ